MVVDYNTEWYNRVFVRKNQYDKVEQNQTKNTNKNDGFLAS